MNEYRLTDYGVECIVTVPVWHLGMTAGELVRRGAVMDKRTEDGDTQTITAYIPPDQITPFSQWLAEETKGDGRVRIVGQ
jgi:translation elongation factor EF-G